MKNHLSFQVTNTTGPISLTDSRVVLQRVGHTSAGSLQALSKNNAGQSCDKAKVTGSTWAQSGQQLLLTDPMRAPLEISEEIFLQKSTRRHKGGERNSTKLSSTTLLALVLMRETHSSTDFSINMSRSWTLQSINTQIMSARNLEGNWLFYKGMQ